MEQALSIFINGLTGVFAGMAVLYFTMKLISLLAQRQQRSQETEESS